jgi:1-acyl-sn-glycerol-3-phosphate acyltransferase
MKPLPPSSTRLLRWFTRYTRWYLRRHFHAVRLAGESPPAVPAETPLVVYTNHPSWWDPLLCLLARDIFFAGRRSFAPIEAAMLERYRFFARLGFFGVEANSARGAVRFLQTSQAILERPDTALWLTPEGRFRDVRERPLQFKAGLGHLATRFPRAVFLPLALELVFWDERTSEALLQFGPPVPFVADAGLDPESCTARLEAQLAATMDQLAEAARPRDPAAFRVLLRGGAGVGGVYDGWRRIRSWLRGEPFQPEHGRS